MAINPKRIDEAAQYRVELKEPITVQGARLHPGQLIHLRGDWVKAFAGSIEHAEKV